MNLARFTRKALPVVAGVVLFASKFAGYAADVPGPFWKVVGLTGAARYMVGTNTIMPLSKGQTVGPGMLVQLAGGSSMADLAAKPQGPQITMFADTILVFSNATLEVAGTATNSPAFQVLQIELRAGKIAVNAKNSSSGQITEVKLPHGIVRSQNAEYSLTDQGALMVYAGKALIALTNMNDAVEVPAGYQWDSTMRLTQPGTPPPNMAPRPAAPAQQNPSRPSGPPPLPHRVF